MKTRKLALFLGATVTLSILAGCSYEPIRTLPDIYFEESDAAADGSEQATDIYPEQPSVQEDWVFPGSDGDTADEDDSQGYALPVHLPEGFFLGLELEYTPSETTDPEDLPEATTPARTDPAEVTAETTATDAEPPSQTGAAGGAPATVYGITNESFIEYNTLASKYTVASSAKKQYLYNFSKALYAGVGVDGSSLPTDAEYGVYGVVNNRTVTFTVYDHTFSKTVESVYLQALDESADNTLQPLGNSWKFSVDTSPFTNGLYRVVVRIVNDTNVALYFYVNGSETWLCNHELLSDSTLQLYRQRRSDLAKLLANGNVTPENSLSLENVTYPFKAVNENYRCDTQLWINISGGIVDSTWSDEHKLYAIHAWIQNNIAYDKYLSENLTNSRAVTYKVFTGEFSTYDLRAGVCFDYANIVAIMCRAQGIPAVTIGSKTMNHVWNAVYINGRWIEYDACASEQYYVGEDVSVRYKTGDPVYGGIYAILPNGINTMAADAEANRYFQQNSSYAY